MYIKHVEQEEKQRNAIVPNKKTIRNKCKENVSNDSNRHNISSDFCVHKIVTKEKKMESNDK